MRHLPAERPAVALDAGYPNRCRLGRVLKWGITRVTCAGSSGFFFGLARKRQCEPQIQSLSPQIGRDSMSASASLPGSVLRQLLAEIVEHDLVMQTIARTVALQAFDRPAFVGRRPQILAIGRDRREVGQKLWLAFDGAEIIERNIFNLELGHGHVPTQTDSAMRAEFPTALESSRPKDGGKGELLSQTRAAKLPTTISAGRSGVRIVASATEPGASRPASLRPKETTPTAWPRPIGKRD
jgi:hypothetical protein